MHELDLIQHGGDVQLNDPSTYPDWWTDDDLFIEKVQPFLTQCEELRQPVTGAALSNLLGLDRLDFAFLTQNREILKKMPKNIQKLVNFMEVDLETMLTIRGGNASGPMFLARQYGYKDVQEINVTHKTMGQVLQNVLDAQILEPQNGST